MLVLVFNACKNESNNNHKPQEDSHAESEDLYTVPGLEHGLLQSPINILSSETKQGDHRIELYFNDEINKIENKGHTVQLSFAPGSTITKDGNTYEFKQIHFHTPSEHHIDGIQYPMEMHVVNTIVDSVNSNAEQYLVLGILFRMGEECLFINEFINEIPDSENASQNIETGTVQLTDLIGEASEENLNYCYHYKGSLTTPPYTESVNWFISKEIYEASSDQLQKINQIEGDNARHVQATYGRVVSED